MSNDPLRIVQVSAAEFGGGAEGIARALHEGLLVRGHDATLLVGRGTAAGRGVSAMGDGPAAGAAHAMVGPLRLLDRQRGIETWRYPRSRSAVTELLPADIVHLHNLHGGYFDLGMLPALSRSTNVLLTLHDVWLLSGHCAHSFDCERWRTGCGSCPDLTIYPAIRRDATAANWQRKQAVYADSRLYVASPSAWLADRVRQSMLAPAVAELRVIPNGVDLDTFAPGSRTDARARLGIADDATVLLAVGARGNPFRDFELALAAAQAAAERAVRDVVLCATGAAAAATGAAAAATGAPAPEARHGRVTLRSVSVAEPSRMADLYRASDIVVHPAKADTFPTSVIEALACAAAVVATRVGGIPEQVTAGTTGLLTRPGDVQEMTEALSALLEDGALRERLGRAAAEDAAARFDANRQFDRYVDWYRSIVAGSD